MKIDKELQVIIDKWEKLISISVKIRVKKLALKSDHLAESEIQSGYLNIYLKLHRSIEQLEEDIVHEMLHYKFRSNEEYINKVFDYLEINPQWTSSMSHEAWGEYDLFVDRLAKQLIKAFAENKQKK